MISEANAAFVNGVGFSAFPLTVYRKTVFAGEPEANCTPNDSIPSWNARVGGILGLRIQGDEGVHYGWVRFTRPDTEPSTPFQVAGYDWNPVVGAPIEAGLPPPPPPVQFQVLPEGLLLGWDYRFTGLVLECADSLTEPVEWRPVEGVEGNQIILPPDEASRFYRLRRP